ncbi:hypothetical protein BC835DRAFT_1421152 [Cytidiella melzeri]|nr:hypothetical protein BC835DRAFT_1421152 [Cytidiella melzeri]
MAYTTDTTTTTTGKTNEESYFPQSTPFDEEVEQKEIIDSDLEPISEVVASGAPSDYIPCLYTLGSTYEVLNGTYADSSSALQQVVDWNKSDLVVRTQKFGDKSYSIPEVVNFNLKTTSDYHSSYGKTATEYTKSLSRENLSHAFTRIAYEVTYYNISLPTTDHIRPLLKSDFVSDLDNMDPTKLYKAYGTHLLWSLTVGGRALFLTATDTRSYSSELSLEAAAKISASYKKAAMNSFNESSESSIATKGGNPSYGNEDLLKNISAWAASIIDYPEFVDFGTNCLTGLWEFASTQARRDVLEKAYGQYVTLYTKDLGVPGPFLKARRTEDYDDSKEAYAKAGDNSYVTYKFPINHSDGWYYISPGLGPYPAVIVKELVTGALATVKWQEIITVEGRYSTSTRFWRAIPPTSDYLAMGVVGVTASSLAELPSQPPPALTGPFRAVHKNALAAAKVGVTYTYSYGHHKCFAIDYIYWSAGTKVPLDQGCFRLYPTTVTLEGEGW